MKNTYKKHKTHIIYTLKLRSKKLVIILILIIFNSTFLFAFKKFEENFLPTVKALATTQSVNYTIKIIDKSLEEVPNVYKDYSNICQITKSESGDIISLTTNTNAIKNIELSLTKLIIKNIEKSHLEDLGIPIGNLTKTYILSGRGPEIPIKILTPSSPDIHIESQFESSGINQSKHKIIIHTDINIQIILPYETISKKVTHESLLSETIIVGKVPDVYVSK